jgi:dynein heavy chain
MYAPMPPVRLVPKAGHVVPTAGAYECPVFKTLSRAGTLSTTGISTNFVLSLELPTDADPRHWIWEGTALMLDVMHEG